ncbi:MULTISPECIES: VOC family protein [unclassified Curtobacterium]|uniref:VOC family protein n=1 Tax=unclassified Curtobacterium TaxID=257496 RepID=UPI000F466051|nr:MULTISPECIES: VOC family protein [unclassified Curtobacterium]ROQ16634.1 hypothetical protein EDF41_1315 [Curtobacterium sp. PhB171]ROQ25290.1 hypothetical protein EDF40_1783 [Curtobacterium sp. PhB170]ROS36742.1 hypothetical protein EDF25_0960 [Curtobacterium sp. PhB131]ROS71418.1 hypothetical protein EDF30_1146 [Curtobacterium sp. PhB141]
MSSYYNAFEMSPVPAPGPDVVAPEPFHGIYGMPSFVTIPTTDLAASVDFWTRGLGFFDLFSVPGQLVHLRRWAFQDVLLVPTASAPDQAPAPAVSVSFACVLNQIDALVTACRAHDAGVVSEPRDTPWGTRDVEVITPEKVRVVFTAAKPFEPTSQTAKNLEAIGITAPDADGEKNGAHA